VSSPSPSPGIDADRHRPIPVSLITGFLGSGKSTLLNHLLASDEMEPTAILINEFGEVAIDHLIVRALDASAVLLKSGCICCTVQGELVDGLKELYMKRLAGTLPPFGRVAIETTGLADPLPIITCLMRDPLFKHAYALDGVITTIDAVHGSAQLDRHVEAVRQAAVADRLVISKADLASDADVARLRLRLRELNPGAAIIEAFHGQVSPRQLFNTGLFDSRAKSIDVQRWLNDDAYDDAQDRDHAHPVDHVHAHHGETDPHVDRNRHDKHIASFCLIFDDPLPWSTFNGWYDAFAAEHGDHILRVKGIVNFRGEPSPFIIHCVQSLQHPPARLPGWPDADRRSRIVFITHDLSQVETEASLREYLARDAPTATAPPAASVSPNTGGRWLNEAEQARLFAALADEPDRSAANVLRLMLLTGVACDDVRTARWQDFDLEGHRWLKPDATQPKGAIRAPQRRIPLGTATMTLILAMRERSSGAGYVFAESGSAISLARIEAAWSAAATRAGIDLIPLTALRPILAVNLFRGLSPELTARLLGLAGPQATAVP
jgi:G3E family GTPase